MSWTAAQTHSRQAKILFGFSLKVIFHLFVEFLEENCKTTTSSLNFRDINFLCLSEVQLEQLLWVFPRVLTRVCYVPVPPTDGLHVLRSGFGLWRLLCSLSGEDMWGKEALQVITALLTSPHTGSPNNASWCHFFLFSPPATSSEWRRRRSDIYGSREFSTWALHLCHR